MESSTRHKIYSYIGVISGAVLVGIGCMMGLDSWITMNTIEAQGIVGQAFNQEQYSQAANNFKIGFLATLGGIIAILNGFVEDVKSTLWEIREE